MKLGKDAPELKVDTQVKGTQDPTDSVQSLNVKVKAVSYTVQLLAVIGSVVITVEEQAV